MKLSRLARLAVPAAVAFLSSLTAPSTVSACTGDCDGNDEVSVAELVQSINVALGTTPLTQCEPIDDTADSQVTVEELVRAVDASVNNCPPPIIQTIAGTGVPGANDDGQIPTNTHLYLPQDMTVGPEGDLYIVDWNNHRIRRIRHGVVQTVAGTGELGDGKDGVGIYTQFNHPTNVEFDHDGNMIIAAWHNSLVKRLSFPDGLDRLDTAFAENVAGTGARSFSGEGAQANTAALDLPSSVVIDSNNEIIISDQANYRLRKVESDGTIHTICGTGSPGFSGDGGPALEARIDSPKGQAAEPAGRIAIDKNDRIYIADTANNCIRFIEPGSFIIDRFAGTGERGFSGDGGPAKEATFDTPSDVAVGPNGAVYVADTMNGRVRVIKTDGTIDTLAGSTADGGFDGDGGPAKDAILDRPYGVSVGPNGTVYIADTHNQRIRQVTGYAPVVPTPAPTPPPEIIPCTGEVGSICTYAGTGATGFSGDGQDRLLTVLYWPFDIEFTSRGRRIVLDWNNHLVREILPRDDEGNETFLTLVGTDTLGDGPPGQTDLLPEGADGLTVSLNHPTDIQELSNGDILFNAWHNHKLRVISGETGRVFVVLGRGAGRNGDGDPLLIADQTLVNQPPHSTLDAAGNLFFIDQRNQRIRVIYNFDQDRKNAFVRTVVGFPGNPDPPVVPGFNGDGPALERQLNFPTGGNPEPSGGLAVVEAEGKTILYFSDTKNNRIRKAEFSSPDFLDGVVTTVAGTGEAGFTGDNGPAIEAKISYPGDMEIGPDGNLYFADTNNNVVRMIDLTTNIITLVAGTGTKGYSGDGGPALEAELNRPFGIAFDAEGDLYISDTFNSRIRKVER